MTDDEIVIAIALGTAPGSKWPGSLIQVPAGFLSRCGRRVPLLRDSELVEGRDPRNRPRLTGAEYRALLDLLMCSDPWPVPDENGDRAHRTLIGLADGEARARGYDNWVVAFHELKPEV